MYAVGEIPSFRNAQGKMKLSFALTSDGRVSGETPMMRVDFLEGYGIEKRIVEIWKRHIGEVLLPVQEKAIQQYGLF
ncbi:MAG: hypothetical protein KJZ78_06330, partial [Bryobacteraceae bacterium]|nr:hypothetical protein [Bryobacteraceae bacterium]